MTRPLEPEVQAHLDAGDPTGLDHHDMRVRRSRLTQEIDRMFDLFGLPGPEVARIDDHQVPVDDGSILIRVYVPYGSSGDLPAHVILHGGGWTTGSIFERVADAQARHRAARAGCVAVLVEYRLAPEHKFPTAVHDVVASVRWIRDHARELGVDPDVITLGGSSAGGNLACAAVLADPTLAVRALLLDVPALDLRWDALSDDLSRSDPRFAPAEKALIEDLWPMYFDDPDHGQSPLASPVLADDLGRFPETFLFLAELDVLRFGAERFADRLAKAGVRVTTSTYRGALHGSLILTRTWSTAERWHDDVLAALNDVHRRAAGPT